MISRIPEDPTGAAIEAFATRTLRMLAPKDPCFDVTPEGYREIMTRALLRSPLRQRPPL